jgi:arginase
MTEIRLLVVPYEVGAIRMGVGRGAERLLEAGAERALASRGAPVRVELVELEEAVRDASGASEAKAGFELVQLVAARAREAIADDAFPVLLSGSCFAGLGMVAGMEEESPGVVWFDAHGDFNTPDSTVDGYFDGMGLAMLTGEAWPSMSSTAMGGNTVPEGAVVLAGARDFDPAEEDRLEASAIRHLPAESIDSPDAVAEGVGNLEPAPSGVYVHVDLDVLDSEVAKVNIYSAPGGLSAAGLEAQVHSLLETCPVRAISLTAYDPECDAGDQVPPIAMRLLEAVAEHVEQGAPEVRDS